MIGRDEAELVGLDWREMIDPTQVDELNAAFSQQAWRRVGDAGRRVIRFLRPDGTVTHVLASGGIVTVDGDRCFLTELQDITEYVSTHQQLQLVLDSTPVSVFLLDHEGQVVASAGTARESPGDDAGSGLHEALGDEPAVLEMVRSAMGGQRVHSIVPSGRCWYDVHLVPVSGAAGRTAVGGVVSDVTERERATAELLDRTARQTALANLAQYALEIGEESALREQIISHVRDAGSRHPRGPRLGLLIPDTMWQLDYRNVNTAIGDLAAAGVETRLDFTELGPIRAITKDNIPPGLGGIRLSGRYIHNLDVGIAIIAGIVRFADLLHLAVAAQGVDTRAQLARVRALGCDLAQGAAVGPPTLTPPW
jgi:PAS domain S-box-containing protein